MGNCAPCKKVNISKESKDKKQNVNELDHIEKHINSLRNIEVFYPKKNKSIQKFEKKGNFSYQKKFSKIEPNSPNTQSLKFSEQCSFFTGSQTSQFFFQNRHNELLGSAVNQKYDENLFLKAPHKGNNKNHPQTKKTKIGIYQNFKFISIAIGMYHCCFTLQDIKTKEMLVYGIGENEFGQLALGMTCKFSPFTNIKHFNNFGLIHTYAGHRSHFFLCIRNDVQYLYASGKNTNGILGVGDNKNKIHATLVPINCNVKELLCSMFFSVILSTSGKIFLSGKIKGTEKSSKYFTQIQDHVKKFVKISIGRSHLITLDNDGKVYGLGSDAYKQLGGSGDKHILSELSYFNDKYCDIKCGLYTSLFLSCDNVAFITGKKSILIKENVIQIESSCSSSYMFINNGDIFTYDINCNVNKMQNVNGMKIKPFCSTNNTNFPRQGIIVYDEKPKLFEYKVLRIRFKDIKKASFIPCCYAIRCSFLKEFILSDKMCKEGLYFDDPKRFKQPITHVIEWIKGNYLPIMNVDDYRNVYFVAQKWKLQCLICFLENNNFFSLYDIESKEFSKVIKLLFAMKEESEVNSKLYHLSLAVVKENISVINEKYGVLIDELGERNELLKRRIKNIADEKGIKVDFEISQSIFLEYEIEKHENSMISDELTKNICFLTSDNVYIKAHSVVMYRSNMIRSIIRENIRTNKTIKVNENSKMFSRIIEYMYLKKINITEFNQKELLKLCEIAKKYKIIGIEMIVKDEIPKK